MYPLPLGEKGWKSMFQVALYLGNTKWTHRMGITAPYIILHARITSLLLPLGYVAFCSLQGQNSFTTWPILSCGQIQRTLSSCPSCCVTLSQLYTSTLSTLYSTTTFLWGCTEQRLRSNLPHKQIYSKQVSMNKEVHKPVPVEEKSHLCPFRCSNEADAYITEPDPEPWSMACFQNWNQCQDTVWHSTLHFGMKLCV